LDNSKVGKWEVGYWEKWRKGRDRKKENWELGNGKNVNRIFRIN
jgi:hypothetical protein